MSVAARGVLVAAPRTPAASLLALHRLCFLPRRRCHLCLLLTPLLPLPPPRRLSPCTRRTSPLPPRTPPAPSLAGLNTHLIPPAGTLLSLLCPRRTPRPTAAPPPPACLRLPAAAPPARSSPPRCANRPARLGRFPARNPTR